MIRAQSGKAWASIRGALTTPGFLRDAVGELAPDVSRSASAVLTWGRSTWPVASGASRDALSVKTVLTDNVVTSTIEGAEYALEIRSSKVGSEVKLSNKQSPAEALAVRASAERGPLELALTRRLADLIQRRLRG